MAVAADRSSGAALVHKIHPARHLDSSYRSPHGRVRCWWDVPQPWHVRLLQPVAAERSERLRRGSDGTQHFESHYRDC